MARGRTASPDRLYTSRKAVNHTFSLYSPFGMPSLDRSSLRSGSGTDSSCQTLLTL